MTILVEALKKKKGLRRYFGPKRAILFTLFFAMVWFLWGLFRAGTLSPEFLQLYNENYPVRAIAIFIVVYAITVVAAIPSLPLNLAAGYFWGGLLGGFYTCLGVTIGGFVSFLVARYLIGQPLAATERSAARHKWLSEIKEELEGSGWKYIAVVRLNPIIPTGAFNFFLGLTSVSGKTFLWTTFVFLLPATIAVSFIGDAFQTFSVDGQVTDIVNNILIVSASIMTLFCIRLAAKILRK